MYVIHTVHLRRTVLYTYCTPKDTVLYIHTVHLRRTVHTVHLPGMNRLGTKLSERGSHFQSRLCSPRFVGTSCPSRMCTAAMRARIRYTDREHVTRAQHRSCAAAFWEKPAAEACSGRACSYRPSASARGICCVRVPCRFAQAPRWPTVASPCFRIYPGREVFDSVMAGPVPITVEFGYAPLPMAAMLLLRPPIELVRFHLTA